jgi:hypothetical protein
VVASPGSPQLQAGRIAGPVQIQRDSDDLEVTDYLAVGFRLDLCDEAVHRLAT